MAVDLLGKLNSLNILCFFRPHREAERKKTTKPKEVKGEKDKGIGREEETQRTNKQRRRDREGG